MPKIGYSWVFVAAIAAYFLKYDLLTVCVLAIMATTLWNLVAAASTNFGYVSKQKYEEVLAKNQILRQQIKDLEVEHEEDLERVRLNSKIEGQNVVFYVYLNEHSKFQYHLNVYKKSKAHNTRSESNTNKNKGSSSKLDWRKVLEVSSDADKEAVDKAYRSLVKKYHPDVNKDSSAPARMQQINEAKEAADSYFSGKYSGRGLDKDRNL